jgi:anaerobic selenocysteine-containing dehydrogenase
MRFRNPQRPFDMVGHGTDLACLFRPLRINGDVALLKGIMKEMLEEDDRTGGKILAHDFIDHHTEGFAEFARDIRAESWDLIVHSSGISRDLIRQAASIAMESERMICSWAMGITQHRNGVANVQTIVNFALLRGQIGRKGAGICPVRRYSNVQGDRTVGIWEKMSPEYLSALGKEFHFSPPEKHGLDTVCTIEAMHKGRVKALICLAEIFSPLRPTLDMSPKRFNDAGSLCRFRQNSIAVI